LWSNSKPQQSFEGIAEYEFHMSSPVLYILQPLSKPVERWLYSLYQGAEQPSGFIIFEENNDSKVKSKRK